MLLWVYFYRLKNVENIWLKNWQWLIITTIIINKINNKPIHFLDIKIKNDNCQQILMEHSTCAGHCAVSFYYLISFHLHTTAWIRLNHKEKGTWNCAVPFTWPRLHSLLVKKKKILTQSQQILSQKNYVTSAFFNFAFHICRPSISH